MPIDGFMFCQFSDMTAIVCKTLLLRAATSHHLLGWLGGAKMACILHHWGVQLILAYSWARPAILVAGKGRGGMFLAQFA